MRKCSISENKSDRISSSPHVIPTLRGGALRVLRQKKEKKVPCHLSTAPKGIKEGQKTIHQAPQFHCKSTLDPYSICRHFWGPKDWINGGTDPGLSKKIIFQRIYTFFFSLKLFYFFICRTCF